MVVLELEGVEIDHCLSCGGIWLDAGEIELLLQDKQMAINLQSQLGERKTMKSEKRKCPICLERMEQVDVGESHPVRIGHCRKNHGLWFDRGELQSVLTIFDPKQHSAVHGLLKNMFGK
jgi:Zn-finger nucleic acid-binding protein